jgi:3,4-dihydroxy-2-butanone 4-phosphate synthase
MGFNTVEEAIEAIRNGEIIIVADEGRKETRKTDANL